MVQTKKKSIFSRCFTNLFLIIEKLVKFILMFSIVSLVHSTIIYKKIGYAKSFLSVKIFDDISVSSNSLFVIHLLICWFLHIHASPFYYQSLLLRYFLSYMLFYVKREHCFRQLNDSAVYGHHFQFRSLILSRRSSHRVPKYTSLFSPMQAEGKMELGSSIYIRIARMLTTS